MKKVVIDPAYELLRQYLEDIPQAFDSLGKVLHGQRNVIREDVVGSIRLVIKSYRRIYLPNRIRYTYFHPSKAKRAFDNAKILLQKGFKTPNPIAYLENTSIGLLNQMFFVCEYTDFQPIESIRENTLEKNTKLLLGLARHTFQLHKQEIYHADYNMGNILFKESNGQYEFSLIDNNRMKFGPINFDDGLKNFVTLAFSLDQLSCIGKEYARLWNVDETSGMHRLLLYKEDQERRHERKKAMKKLLRDLKSK